MAGLRNWEIILESNQEKSLGRIRPQEDFRKILWQLPAGMRPTEMRPNVVTKALLTLGGEAAAETREEKPGVHNYRG